MSVFNDPFESPHIPVFSGLMLGLMVLVVFGLLFALVFDPKYVGLENDPLEKLRAQQNSIEELRAAIKARTISTKAREKNRNREFNRRSKIGERLDGTKFQLEETLCDIERLRCQKTSLEEEIQALNRQWAAYVDRYRKSERERAKGERYPALELTDGRLLESVEVIDVDAARMLVRHKGGLTGIPWRKLPAEIRDRFQFDPSGEEETRNPESRTTRSERFWREADELSAGIGRRMRIIDSNKTAIGHARAAIRILEERARKVPDLIGRKARRIEREERRDSELAEKFRDELAKLARQQEAIPCKIREIQNKIGAMAEENRKLAAEIADLRARIALLQAKARALQADP